MTQASLPPFPNPKNRLHISTFVNRASIHLRPRVRLKRHFLRTCYHLGGHALASQQTSRHCRALQTEDTLGVPDASVVHRRTDLVDHIWSRMALRDLPTHNTSAHSAKVATKAKQVIQQEADKSFPKQDPHQRFSFTTLTPSSWQMNANLSVSASILRVSG